RNHSRLGDCAYRPSSRASAHDIVPANAAIARIRAAVLHRPYHSTSASRSSAGVHATNTNAWNIVIPKLLLQSAPPHCLRPRAAEISGRYCGLGGEKAGTRKTQARRGLWLPAAAAGEDDAWVLGLKYRSVTGSVARCCLGPGRHQPAGQTGSKQSKMPYPHVRPFLLVLACCSCESELRAAIDAI